MRSRPCHLSRINPAPASTSRCFVTAWRETRARAPRRAIDPGPPADRRSTSPRRVSSPSAANSGAASRTAAAASGIASDLDMLAHLLELRLPARVVHAEGLVAAMRRKLIEARLHDVQLGAAGDVFQPELDQRHRLARV